MRSAIARREREQGERDLEREDAAAEARVAHERHDVGDVERRAQRELRGRQLEVDERHDERRAERGQGGDVEDPQRGARHASQERPREHEAERDEADRHEQREEREEARRRRAASSRRVSDSDGITNCGAGPCPGPDGEREGAADGCPSAEITRQ